MSDIKYIHCFGTSYTAGGGFEWETNDSTRKELLETHYGHLDEEKTQYNFSWPGRLQKLIPNIQILNHAKQGTGNDRMYRKVYETVDDLFFKKEEHLFILEFSNFGRLEEFNNKINKFLVVNYRHSHKNVEQVDVAQSYFYDSEEDIKFIDEFYEKYKPYFEISFHEQTEFKRIARNTSFFLHWMKSNNLNVLFSSKPDIYNQVDYKFINTFECINYNKSLHNSKQFNLEGFIHHWPLQIKKETNYKFDDFHSGFKGNNIIAKIVYNKLLDMKIISGNIESVSDSMNLL